MVWAVAGEAGECTAVLMQSVGQPVFFRKMRESPCFLKEPRTLGKLAGQRRTHRLRRGSSFCQRDCLARSRARAPPAPRAAAARRRAHMRSQRSKILCSVSPCVRRVAPCGMLCRTALARSPPNTSTVEQHL